ncbi:DEAD/DEAH box helicase [[Mycobacterium] kokjensenii]|uniref:DEAD/DEAH box helicase n=1 Tax=[Mycobacterium] kokjensenii TaxID=3064287 RepID=A0ABN9MRS1_9MYCO|nr:DEAD/DEAH box helicase [Mycolicibacter sp. MU0083]CAJ1493898.1 DEAD/DEAH box helicase [Mycolicibacter sp. MU0083]
MTTFEDLISRAADPLLQRLVGREIVHLLAGLDPQLARPDRLGEIAVGLRSPADMLLDNAIRPELLMLLPPGSARLLAQRLRLEGDPYVALSSMSVRRGSSRAAALLDFFSVSDESEERIVPPALEAVLPDYPLFDHQRLAARRVLDHLRDEPHRVMLHMPTGSGKTRTAMSLISTLLNQGEQKLVVWLAHSEELCEQAVEEFKKAWTAKGNRPVDVQRWWGPHDLRLPVIRDGIVVAGLSKAFASARRSLVDIGAIAGHTSLVVMDEAHQAIATTYQQLLEVLTEAGRPAPLLGLTATPGRTWNDIDEDERLADFFYRRKVSLEVRGYDNPVRYLIDEGYLAETDFVQLDYTSNSELSPADLAELADALDIPQRIIQSLAADEQRNMLILNQTETMCHKHHRVIVFAATKDHAVVLATVLRARGYWAYAVTGETPKGDRARIISSYRAASDEPRVIVNYGVLTTGFDAPQTSGAVIARPTKSLVLFSQMVGRATRGLKAGGNKTAQVATVVDTRLPGFCNMAEAFDNWEDVW